MDISPTSASPDASPRRPSTNSSPWGFGKAQCDCRELKVPRLNADLENTFANRMKTFDANKGHSNVAALLLSWEDTDLRLLDDELDRLEKVFREVYNYTVERALIPKHIDDAAFETIRLVANFIAQHNSAGSLVLIYYAGHGMKRQDDEFRMARTTNDDPDICLQRRTKRNTIVWNEVEKVVLKTKPDLLIIFDCCQSGALTQSSTRNVQSERIIEFIASCMPDDVARGPGDDSFTSALISALHSLSKQRLEGFTVGELMQHIEESEHFRDFNQIPKAGFRGTHQASQRLRLKPLVQPSAKPPPTVQQPSEGGGEVVTQCQHVLRLNLELSELPSDDHVVELAEDMAQLMRSSSAPIVNISWGLLGTRFEQIKLRKWHDVVTVAVRQNQHKFASGSPHLRVPVHSRPSPSSDSDLQALDNGAADLQVAAFSSASRSASIATSQRWMGVAPVVTLAFLACCSLHWTRAARTSWWPL